ncbi:MAG TPA: PDZ domain-containing protein, partial [Pirellula sp.]|nr:PDZ domain-containing protein [Pirellula sp.]
KQILETGKMRRGWLGVELVKASDWKRHFQARLASQTESIDSEFPIEHSLEAARLPVRGAAVQRVVVNSPAAAAGLRVGDTIVEMNGNRIKGVDDLIFAIGKTPVGDKVGFTIMRDEVQIKCEVAVGERPDRP